MKKTIVIALIVTFTLAACGKKGELQPPKRTLAETPLTE